MKRMIKIWVAIIFMIAMLSITTKVQAATATITASKNNATVGDEVNIIVKYTAAAWELTASGNGISTTKYVDVTSDAENATTTKTIKLDTSSAGTKEIKLTGTVSDGTTGATSKINTSVKVTVKEKSSSTENAGSNNNSSTTTKTESAKVSSCTVNGVTIKESLKVTNKESVSVVIKTSTGENATIVNSLTRKILYS